MVSFRQILCTVTSSLALVQTAPWEPSNTPSTNLHVDYKRTSWGTQPEPYEFTCRQDCAGGNGNPITFLQACVESIINAIGDMIHEKEEQFTQSQVDQLVKNWPQLNVMVIHGPHDHNLVGDTHYHVELPLSGEFTQGYDIYTFESGDITLHGDGSYRNWCFSGLWTRDGDQGHHVTFYKIPDPPQPILPDFVPGLPNPSNQQPFTPPDPVIPPQPIRRTNGDGIYMVNCQRDSVISSGVAYYKELRDGGNWGQQPDDYVDTSHGWNTNWEDPGFVIFPSTNTRVSWRINNDAQQQPDFASVGSADNTYVNFWVYKDKQPNTLYTVDGWDCTSVYWGY